MGPARHGTKRSWHGRKMAWHGTTRRERLTPLSLPYIAKFGLGANVTNHFVIVIILFFIFYLSRET